MNSYLDLVKEYAEKHKRKNRMSLFVILLAVALVATIFGMADMELQTQQKMCIRDSICTARNPMK